MKLAPWIIASGLVVVLCYTACAFPDFQYLPEPADDDDTTATGGDATGGGGYGGESTGGGGEGGSWPCNPYELDACGHGQKCSVIDENLGIPDGLGCTDAGQRPAWTRCAANEECDDGLWCDHLTGICRPICTNANACPTGATCHPMTKNGSADTVPGLQACTSHCHPETGNPCNDTFNQTTCYYDDTLQEFDCAATLGRQDLQECNTPTDCAKGLACVYWIINYCTPWCTPPGEASDCPMGSTCEDPANLNVTYGATPYGICV